MFQLSASRNQSSIFLTDQSALSLTTALLSEDLDDRIDLFRGVLELDPFFALWTISEADSLDNVNLTTIHQASRWLEQRFLTCVTPAKLIASDRQRKSDFVAWQSIIATSVSTARHARELAFRHHAEADQAYWFALLCSCRMQIDSLVKLNGHSPLKGASWQFPCWLRDLQKKTKRCTEKRDARFAAQQALVFTPSTDKNWLSDSECLELTRTLPEARRLVPAALKNLARVEQLELDFSETLHREKMASMQQLAYGASHEINNPLANISTRAQSLMRDEHDADRRQKLEAINKQAFRAYEMIADLMLFAKPPKLQIQSVHLNRLLQKLRDEIEESSSDVICQIKADGLAVLIPGDEVQLGVAIKAICQNGIEAMGNQGKLLIELSHVNKHCIEISIEDSGHGLSELAKRHLFDPFFSGREAGRGMGFGLSKAWRIIERHHGRILVTSDPERGSCFTITLPTESSNAQI